MSAEKKLELCHVPTDCDYLGLPGSALSLHLAGCLPGGVPGAHALAAGDRPRVLVVSDVVTGHTPGSLHPLGFRSVHCKQRKVTSENKISELK